jgi:hypothetical protein
MAAEVGRVEESGDSFVCCLSGLGHGCASPIGRLRSYSRSGEAAMRASYVSIASAMPYRSGGFDVGFGFRTGVGCAAAGASSTWSNCQPSARAFSIRASASGSWYGPPIPTAVTT